VTVDELLARLVPAGALGIVCCPSARHADALLEELVPLLAAPLEAEVHLTRREIWFAQGVRLRFQSGALDRTAHVFDGLRPTFIWFPRMPVEEVWDQATRCCGVVIWSDWIPRALGRPPER